MPYTTVEFMKELETSIVSYVDRKIEKDPNELPYRYAYQYGAIIGVLSGTLSALNLTDEQLKLLEDRVKYIDANILK